MKVIKSIEIRNFQSHAHTIVEFAGAGQLTALIGASDQGKTAVARAIKWALFNEPRGLDMIRVGTEFAQVSLKYEDDTEVIRERRKSVNRYTLIQPGREPQIFDGFGDGVPLEIQQATGVYPVAIGNQEFKLQLSEQLDGAFLGKHTTSGYQRAQTLDKLAGAEVVDRAAKDTVRDLRRASLDETRLKGELESLERDIAGYDYLPALEATIERLTAIQGDMSTAAERKSNLCRLSGELTATSFKRNQAQAIVDKWDKVPEQVEERLQSAQELTAQRDRFFALLSSLNECDANRNAALDVLRRTAKVEDVFNLLSLAAEMTERQRNLWLKRAARQAMLADRERAAAVMTITADVDQAANRLSQASLEAQRLVSLRSLAQRKAAANTARARVLAILDALAEVNVACAWTSQAEEELHRHHRVRNIRNSLRDVHEQARMARIKADMLATVPAAEERLNQAATLTERRLRLVRIGAVHRDLESRQVLAEIDCEKAKCEIAAAEEAYRKELVDAGTCPTCGSEIHSDRVLCPV